MREKGSAKVDWPTRVRHLTYHSCLEKQVIIKSLETAHNNRVIGKLLLNPSYYLLTARRQTQRNN